MDALDALGLFAAVIPFIIGVSLFWFLGGMPGRVAEKTGHPDVEAIRIGVACSWRRWLAMGPDVGVSKATMREWRL